MERWRNAKRHLLRAVLLTGATLLPLSGARGEVLTSSAAPGAAQVETPRIPRRDVRQSFHALMRSLGQGVAELHQDLVQEIVATQLAMIGGHPFTPPPPTDTPPTGTNNPPTSNPPGNTPPPPPPPTPGGGNPPPPPPTGGGNTPPPQPPTGNGNPPPDNPPPPPGPPVPPTDSPEPASVVTALLGAGLASLAAWRHRRRKQPQKA
jgi:hypothetical protein